MNSHKHKILIDVDTSKGHLNATLKIAYKLKKHGYKIIYGTGINFKDNIEKMEFEFYYLPSVKIMKVNSGIKKYNFVTIFFFDYLL